MMRYRFPWDRTGEPHARIELPPLSASEALLIFDILQRVSDSIWETHDDAMIELLSDCLVDEPEPDDNSGCLPRRC